MAYQSLYRRYRSQRFAEVLGQDHVTGALRNAVREDRVGHGYLFSGPRGTGKTSTARILAKVLNCENPADGEPCTVCDNCVAVAEGRSVDWLHELDAASNNGVDAMRDLLGRVSMGTSGNRKVYILDEVHMLSKGASNTLLKTLEEPPAHVVFVLATTEPEKVLPTIRSRTQHFDFKLLPAETLAAHVRHVIDDAGLDLGDDAVEFVVRAGAGSARDTLSALDQVAAAGGVDEIASPIDDIVAALGDRDAGAALVAVDSLVRSGQHPRTLADSLIAALRDAFLVAMGAPGGGLTDFAEASARATAENLGPATLTAALEGIGGAIVEMRHAPDPRIPLEVALVRLTRSAAGGADPDLLARIEALEAAVRGGAASAPTAAPATASAPSDPSPTPTSAAPAQPATSAPRPSGSSGSGGGRAAAARASLAARDAGEGQAAAPQSSPPTSRPSLGGVRKAQTAPAPAPAPEAPAPDAPAPAASAPDETTPAAAPADPTPPQAEAPDEPRSATAGGVPSIDDVAAGWPDLLDSLRGRAKALYKLGRPSSVEGNTIHITVPNTAHRNHCAEKQAEVEAVLSERFGTAIRLALTIGDDAGSAPSGPGPTAPSASTTAVPAAGEAEEQIDLDELTDAPDASTGGVASLTDAFPGAEILEDP